MPSDEAEAKKKKPSSGRLKKFLWDVLDRVMFIGIGVVGGVTTSYLTGIIKVNPPELVVRQTYSRIDSGPVAKNVGGLKLDYQEEAPRPYGVWRLDIANEGRGPAEKVRFQVKLPQALAAAYDVEPDFKVYKQESMALEGGEFYAELGVFPSEARDFLALRIEGDAGLLCGARVKIVNDEVEGEVGPLKGVEGCE